MGPLYCVRNGSERLIHMAGGDARIEEKAGARHFLERHLLLDLPVEPARANLKRAPCGMVEFHCMLVRTEVFEKLGPLDEGLRSTREHIDLCMQVRAAGREVWFDPAAMVTYVPVPQFEEDDYAYFFLRWGDEWTLASLDRFAQKWRLSPDDPSRAEHLYWISHFRSRVLVTDPNALPWLASSGGTPAP